MARNTIRDIMKKKGNEKIASLTAYDFPTAKLLDEAGLDLLLVGDSVGNVVYGYPTTIPVTMNQMIAHTEAVVRGSEKALVVGDMPFGSYQSSEAQAIENACRFLKEAGAQAVKLEGGEKFAPLIQRLVEIGIPVMAHIGLLPQSVNQLSGYRTHGKNPEEAELLMKDAMAVAKAGAFSVVLECVKEDIAEAITNEIPVPTIGIGSGKNCDGQILVTHDLLGFTTGCIPKFVHPLANVRETVSDTAALFVSNVREGKQ